MAKNGYVDPKYSFSSVDILKSIIHASWKDSVVFENKNGSYIFLMGWGCGLLH